MQLPSSFSVTLNGAEYMGRVFLIEPEQVDLQTRSSDLQKDALHGHTLNLEAIAEENGVAELYLYAVSSFSQYLQRHTTRSSIGFTGPINGSRKTVISLPPGESNAPMDCVSRYTETVLPKWPIYRRMK